MLQVINFPDDWDEEYEDEEFHELAVQVLFPSRAKVFHPRRNYFIELRDDEFFDRFRLSKPTVQFIVDKICDKIACTTNWNHALTSEEKVLLALRYYASGSLLIVCGDFLGVHKSTASRVIKLVSRTLASLRAEYINFPETVEERNAVVQDFYNIACFPHVIGAIDCTHIKIRSPGGHDAEVYRNRKSFFSLNVQTICDSGLHIQSIVCRWPGSAQDSTIFRHSAVKTRFENGAFGDMLLVGDAGYPILNYLLTPLHNPTNHAERTYNAAQIATRNPVERSYGVWKRHFPILRMGINIKVTTGISVVLATAVLHNIALVFGEQIPRITVEEERLVELTIFPAVPLPPETAVAGEQPEGRQLTETQACRNRLIRYFSTP